MNILPFGIWHAKNANSTLFSTINLIVYGLWLSAGYFKTRSLWLPTGLHAGWNFFLGALFGLNVSGLDLHNHYALLKSTDSGPVWLTGGKFGPEASIGALIVLSFTTLWLIKTDLLLPSREMIEQLEINTIIITNQRA